MIDIPELVQSSGEELPYLELAVEPGLRLVQVQPNQVDRMFELVDNDKEYLGKWLPWVERTKSVEDSLAYINLMLASRRNGSEYGYGIELDGQMVGHASLMHLIDDKEPEIGYWIASNISRQGITTKVADRLTTFGLDSLGLDHIIIRARPDNIASNRIAEKLGYVFTGNVPDGENTLNVWEIKK